MKLQILRKLIPIACLLVSMNVLAYDFKSGGIYYHITSTEAKTVEVTCKDSNYNSYTGEVTIPGSVTHAETTFKVTSIGSRAFRDCSGLTSITIPNSVTSIGYEAFYGCSGLTSVTIPNSVTQIGNYVFDNCTSLKDLKIEDGTEILELRYNDYYSSGTEEGLFYDCPLETVYLGRNLSYNTDERYGYSPFYNQKALKTITIGNSVTSIGDYAFSNCSGLTSITIGNSVTSIGGSAFSGCSGLTSITIPNSATSVGSYAFNGCTSLKDLKIEDGTEILELGYNYKRQLL